MDHPVDRGRGLPALRPVHRLLELPEEPPDLGAAAGATLQLADLLSQHVQREPSPGARQG